MRVSLPGVRTGAEGRSQICSVNADGSEPRQLTFARGSNIEPRWSPDGRHIAFASGPEVWLMRADGANQRRVSPAGLGASEFDLWPTWSPDGTALLFSSNRGSGDEFVFDLHSMKLDGTKLDRLTQTVFNDEILSDWQVL